MSLYVPSYHPSERARHALDRGDSRYCRVNVIKSIPRIIWPLFSFFWISLFQSFLLFAISAGPTYVLLLSSQKEPQIKPTDFLYLSIQILLVLSEYIFDGQQWSRSHKYSHWRSRHRTKKHGGR